MEVARGEAVAVERLFKLGLVGVVNTRAHVLVGELFVLAHRGRGGDGGAVVGAGRKAEGEGDSDRKVDDEFLHSVFLRFVRRTPALYL